MPCFDKKLEATRKDFQTPLGIAAAAGEAPKLVPDVDCVLTASVVLELMQESDGVGGGSEDAAEGGAAAPAVAAAAAPAAAGGGVASLEATLGFTRGTNASGEECVVGGPCAEGGSSGGYLDFVFRFAAQELFGVRVQGPLRFKRGRNIDFQEVVLKGGGGGGPGGPGGDEAAAAEAAAAAAGGGGGGADAGGDTAMATAAAGDGGTPPVATKALARPRPVLRFARAYGFRNIQTIVNKIKRGNCPYDFVEIMACPSGCVNGGGQAKAIVAESDQAAVSAAGTSTQDAKANISKVDAALHSRIVRSPQDSAVAQLLYGGAGAAAASDGAAAASGFTAPFCVEARRLLHTRYHAVPPMDAAQPLGIRW